MSCNIYSFDLLSYIVCYTHRTDVRHHGLSTGNRVRRNGRRIRVVSSVIVEVALSLGLRGYARGTDVPIAGGGSRGLQRIQLAGTRRLDSRCGPHG